MVTILKNFPQVAQVIRTDPGKVKVIHGASDGVFPVAGHPVEAIRRSLVDAFNIPKSAIALANGRHVSPGYRVRAGDVLEFVQPWGEKGAHGRKITEEDLKRLGLKVVGNQIVRLEDSTPDATWELDRLVTFAEAQLTLSAGAERESLLQAHKSAVALYWAGCSLFFIRSLCKSKGHGEWKKLKLERGWKNTTANDAIRLYRNAKTPDALVNLGITEAKEKYVYPFKDEDDDESEPDAAPSQESNNPPAGRGGKRGRGTSGRPSQAADDQPDDDTETAEEETAEQAPAGSTLAKELEEIAQRLTEIALNELGKVEDVKTLFDATAAVSNSVEKLVEKINERLPD